MNSTFAFVKRHVKVEDHKAILAEQRGAERLEGAASRVAKARAKRQRKAARRLALAMLLVSLVAVSAFAQSRVKALYKVFRFSPTTIGVSCANGSTPFVTDAPRGSAILIVTCAEPK